MGLYRALLHKYEPVLRLLGRARPDSMVAPSATALQGMFNWRYLGARRVQHPTSRPGVIAGRLHRLGGCSIHGAVSNFEFANLKLF
jgi:hypothetical protein